MKIKSVTCEYISKPLKELQIGDRVLGVNGDRPKILNIQKNGVQPTFTVKLSDGRSFRAGKGHFNTVHFRNSKLRPGKKVYDVLTVEYIKDHLNEYLFEIPTDDTFNLSEIDFWQHIEMLPCHENEPADQEDIIPDLNKDPNKVYIESIVPDGEEECWCLQLNDPLGLFAIEDRIFTHNSLLTNLILAYIIVLFGLMRKPYQLLGHSPMTAYSVGMCSATLNKAWDLLGVPFEQLIEQSPFFEKVGRHDDIVRVNEEDKECSKCYYTTAARGSAKMVFRNNLQLKLVSTEGALLGNTFVACMMTELAWWEQMGWTKEDIFRFFSKADQRVTSRMNGHYLGRSIIDSSPFSMESPIDKWIWEVALQDPKWYCVLGSKWDWFPDQFPNYFDKDGNEIHNWDVAFQCYKGGKSEPPKAISTAAEASTYDPLDLVWCPRENINSKGKVDFLQMAKQNAVEFLRDWAGIPAGSSDRIFQAGSTIDRIFDNDLRNIYTSIVADAMEQPEHLIWNKIKDIFFTKFGSQYMFYREPNAKRVLAVDQSTTGDATAISVCHNEYIKDGEDLLTVTIVDMTIVIIPKGGAVNLEAIKYFIQDLIDIGNLTIGNINFDKFQSDSTVQTLKRRGYKLDYISADKSNEPYTLLVDAIMHGRVFAGKNLFFKNNLRSLHMAQRESGSLKYDHFKGKICNESADTDWFSSQLGVNAKDCSDTVAECHCMLQKYATDYAPVREFVAYKKSGVEYNKELAALGLSI